MFDPGLAGKSILANELEFETFAAPQADRAVSSVVEHYLDTVGVTGSNPVPRTSFSTNKYGPKVTFKPSG